MKKIASIGKYLMVAMIGAIASMLAFATFFGLKYPPGGFSQNAFDAWIVPNGKGLLLGPAVIRSCKRIELYKIPFDKPDAVVRTEDENFNDLVQWISSRIESRLNYHKTIPDFEASVPWYFLVLYSTETGPSSQTIIKDMQPVCSGQKCRLTIFF